MKLAESIKAINVASVKTTIDIPEEVLKRTKIAAVQRNTSVKRLVIEGLEKVLESDSKDYQPKEALRRLRQGYAL